MIKTEEERVSYSGLLISSAMGGAVGTVLSIILLFVFAFLISEGKLPESLSEPLVVAAAFVGATASGVASAKRQGRGVVVSGICGGIAYMIIILLVTALGGSGGVFGPMTLKLVICAVAGGAFGGTLCSGGKKKKRRRRRKR
ncbi:MAG TPA: TIGR04086 family membrane protein [Clostridiales bacterium]|nr:TIGR04086 family membrane protein [Clostridiales bacterium]